MVPMSVPAFAAWRAIGTVKLLSEFPSFGARRQFQAVNGAACMGGDEYIRYRLALADCWGSRNLL